MESIPNCGKRFARWHGLTSTHFRFTQGKDLEQRQAFLGFFETLDILNDNPGFTILGDVKGVE